jgi:hypothetical protein
MPTASTAGPPIIPGWWRVGGVKGEKAVIAKVVGAMTGIPDHWKAALIAEINNHDANAVTVHASFSQENKKVGGKVTKGKLLLHLDISPLEGFVTG